MTFEFALHTIFVRVLILSSFVFSPKLDLIITDLYSWPLFIYIYQHVSQLLYPPLPPLFSSISCDHFPTSRITSNISLLRVFSGKQSESLFFQQGKAFYWIHSWWLLSFILLVYCEVLVSASHSVAWLPFAVPVFCLLCCFVYIIWSRIYSGFF